MNNRLIVVSNRLPVQLEKTDSGYELTSTVGGLITALQRVLREHEGIWVGWPGSSEDEFPSDAFETAAADHGLRLEPIYLSEPECKGFYQGFSNEIVWPLFHDLQSRCNFDPEYWHVYQTVNERFADRVMGLATASDLIWVHDYHLLEVGRYLRRSHVRSSIVYFQHIPFPPPDIFEKLPWRSEVLAAMLNYDVVGFQTVRDRRNFISCLRLLDSKLPVTTGGQRHVVHFEGREVQIGHYPIGIDFSEFSHAASERLIQFQAEEIKARFGNRPMILGVDRLDYTKGIPERLIAYREFLRRRPDFHRKVTLLQVVVPSREAIPKYQELKAEVETLVGTINGEFTQPGWVPIHYIHRSLTREELVAYYCAADVALVTPLKDGMNLVAKEFCACKTRNDGVLILSEFAGTAAESKSGALLVNPYHVLEVATAISRALEMDSMERSVRMKRLRRQFRRNDVYRWARHFIRAAEDCRGSGIPAMSTHPFLQLSASSS